jgi:hypothetical protein
MRRLLVVFALFAAVAAAQASAAKLADPCVLITTVDASTVLGSNPPKAKAQAVAGGSLSCSYTVKKKSLVVTTKHVAAKSAFVKAATSSGPAYPMHGVGADAFSAGNGTKILVWKNGTQITISFAGLNPVVSTQQSLAKTALGRL